MIKDGGDHFCFYATNLVRSLVSGTWNSSALMIATQHARIEIAHFLLSEIGIEIDRVNDKGVTALFVACAGEIFVPKSKGLNLISPGAKRVHFVMSFPLLILQ